MEIENQILKTNINDFLTISLIGKGSYASVLLVKHNKSN